VLKRTDNFNINPLGLNVHYISLAKTPELCYTPTCWLFAANRNIRPANKGTKDSLTTCEWQWERKFEAAS